MVTGKICRTFCLIWIIWLQVVVSFVLLDDLVVEDLLLVMYDDIYSIWLPCIFDLINSFLRYVLFPSSFYSFYHLCQSSFLMKFQVKVCNFIKETLSQLVFCKFYRIPKNTFSCRTPLLAASENRYKHTWWHIERMLFTKHWTIRKDSDRRSFTRENREKYRIFREIALVIISN